jgi:hypothetical protein
VDDRWIRRALFLLALLGGTLGLVVALTGTLRDAVRTGLVVAAVVAIATIAWTLIAPPAGHDPSRRRGRGVAAAGGGRVLR